MKIELGPGEIFINGSSVGKVSTGSYFVEDKKLLISISPPKDLEFSLQFKLTDSSVRTARKALRRRLRHSVRKAYLRDIKTKKGLPRS